jgi:imidazolonepropionase-like amidohydrolase
MSVLVLRNAAVLDVAKGVLRSPCDVAIEGGRISYVGPLAPQQVVSDVIDVGGRTVMPGLIDLHVHVTAVSMQLGRQPQLPNVFVLLRTMPILEGMLMRGFTSVRDAGGAEAALADAVKQGLAVGPRLFVSGRALSQTGGHGDFRERSDYLEPTNVCACSFRSGAIARVVDGVEGVRKAVREELQMGASQIKIMASGGVSSPTDPIDALGYSIDEVRAIVAEAASRHTYVMAHAYTAEAIIRAVQCGVRTIEHGNLVDARAAAVMARYGAFAVPTLITYHALMEQGAELGLTPAMIEKAHRVLQQGIDALRILHDAGVQIGFGSDLLGDAHSRQSEELVLRAQVQTPQQVLASATVVAAEVLQMKGQLGVVAEGAIADLLVIDGNPLESIECLARPAENLRLILKDGLIVKRLGI